MPFTQAVVACGPVHVWPQLPQFLGSVSRFVSHPSLGFPLQSPNPGVQATIRHVPFTHAVVAFGAVQVVPQLPQF